MGRLVLPAYVVLALLFAYYYASLGEESERRPLPQIPRQTPIQTAPELAHDPGVGGRRPLPAPSRRDPSITVDDTGPCRKACTGTAFAIDEAGRWLTARHVIDGCRELGLLTGRRGLAPAEVTAVHPIADLALLRTRQTAPPLAMSAAPLFPHQDGFDLGFPAGEPGAVHTKLIGRVGLRSGAGRGARQPGIAWAEVSRVPAGSGPLGGLSGGPVLADSGDVVGVAIAASPRRGRVISAARISMNELFHQAGLDRLPAAGRGQPIGAGTYAREGERLRGRLTVAQVYCRGGPRRRG